MRLAAASPIAVREIEGHPAWIDRERYDITAKPPAGATRQQRAEMMRRMFAERMKLTAHVEETPEFFTAIQEQLGLKVQPDTMKMPVFIVDSMERPSEN